MAEDPGFKATRRHPGPEDPRHFMAAEGHRKAVHTLPGLLVEWRALDRRNRNRPRDAAMRLEPRRHPGRGCRPMPGTGGEGKRRAVLLPSPLCAARPKGGARMTMRAPIALTDTQRALLEFIRSSVQR